MLYEHTRGQVNDLSSFVQYCSGCVVLSVLFRLCCSISIVPSVLSYLYCAIMYERNADRKYEGDRDAKEQNTKE